MKGKRFFAGILTALYLIQPLNVLAEGDIPESQILVELRTGTVLYEESADKPLPVASITKLMGMILVGEAMERGELTKNDVLTCSEYAKSMGGSEIWLKAGEQMSVDDLLKAVMIASANDAMMVFAEKIGGSEEGFVQMMNRKAEEMGLVNTHFVNAVGFDEEGHYSCARDVAKMAAELQKYPELLEYSTVWMDSLRGGETMLVNTNRLVRFYEGTTGLKTGTTDGAGHCLCATAKRGELELCSVVLGCRSSDGRFEASKQLLNHGFGQYCFYTPERISPEPLPVIHGTQEQVSLQAEYPNGIVISREDAQNIRTELPDMEEVQAPVEKGQPLAQVKIYAGEKEICVYQLLAAESVEELNFKKCLQLLWQATASIEKNAEKQVGM